nr:MAG TPA: terminase large subunit [Caudoviricetes sp.]
MANVYKRVNEHFREFVGDWNSRFYFLLGGYGSSKSYHIALKIILKCIREKRKVLVIREVYETIRESCFSLFEELAEDLHLTDDKHGQPVMRFVQSPMKIKFKNGSQIIFKGMDKPAKLKSINGVTIIWIEEASELKYAGYKELLGRARHPFLSIHFILSENPVDKENWTYKQFFRDEENNRFVMDDEELYKKRIIRTKDTYYHHSTVDDNHFLPASYIEQLDEIRSYDPDLYRIARLGHFGINGTKVLPQFEVAKSHQEVMSKVASIPDKFKFNGMDFGFETSYNAVVRMAVDDQQKILYIYWEYYKNRMTDDKTAKELREFGLDKVQIVADCEDPKAIAFYRQNGFRMRGCHKFPGSRLANTRKIKRFHRIICSPDCLNTIKELSTLIYSKDRQDRPIYDQFNIDPHTFSAIWYALDNYEVADIKQIPRNSRRGGL